MPKLTILVGPPGSGKSTFAKTLQDTVYINQDSQGKEGHKLLFHEALHAGKDIVVDRMNFNKAQRNIYLGPAKEHGYATEIQVIHESTKVCTVRCFMRTDHETVKTPEDARKALDFFFKNYERVDDNEADSVVRHGWSNKKPPAIICDLDGTLCNIDHRLHWVRGERKNWPMFFAGIKNDTLNQWCAVILNQMKTGYGLEMPIVLCSGRGQEYRESTEEWLADKDIFYDGLFMRFAGDHRPDHVIKEILLDFEILTKYEPYLIIDDRKQVVDMWRRRGYICLQCAEGDF